MNRYLGITLLTATLYISCDVAPSQNQSINGVWESLGSGWLLEIKDSSSYATYDITTISCLPSQEGKLSEVQGSIELKGDTLCQLKGVITYKYIKINELPELCTTNLDARKVKDPLFNFEVFLETVKEHYAFLELNSINWMELSDEQRAKLNTQSTDAELYIAIEETLERLNDNHAFLEATVEVYESVDKIIAQEEQSEDLTTNYDLPEYGDFQVAKMVAEHHLKEDMTEDSWLIHWGKLNNNIGYIQIKSMWLYADLDLPQDLIDDIGFVDAYVETFHKMYEGNYVNMEVKGVRKIMDKILNDLSSMESIIIDVRFNGGGQDAVSFEILSRFIPERLQVATQKLRYGDQHTPVLPLFIDGTEDAFTKPVYILSSQQTGSAAESFSIASMSMNNASRIGSPSSGAISTALEKSLPNGWAFAISNEIYSDNQGNIYENVGVPVDVNLNYPKDRQTFFRSVVDDLDTDKQNILNAIGILEEK